MKIIARIEHQRPDFLERGPNPCQVRTPHGQMAHKIAAASKSRTTRMRKGGSIGCDFKVNTACSAQGITCFKNKLCSA